jgi:putative ATPase
MEAPLAERIRPQKIRRLHQSIPSGRTNGSLTQQIIKGIIPSNFGVHPNWQNHIGTNYCTRIETSIYILSAINSGVKDIRDVIEKQSKVVVYSLQNPILL